MKPAGILAFRRIVCVRCGERRIVGVACPTCGLAPDEREVDPDRQRRVRLVGVALEILNGAAPEPSPDLSTLATEAWGRIAGVLDEVLAAIMGAIEDANQEQALMDALKAFRQLEADVAAAPRLRPWIDLWTTVEDVLSRLRGIVGHYLGAATADLPMEAQRESRIAQAELDAAVDLAAVLSERMATWARVEAAETMDEAIRRLAENSFARSEAHSLLEFDRAGHAVYERVTGEAASVRGFGVGLNLIAQQAQGRFDESRVWSVARETYSLLTADHAWVTTLVSDEVWRGDFKTALVKLWDAGRLQAAAAAAVRHDRQAVRVLLDVGQDLVESTGKRYIASMMAASKRLAYATYRDQSAGALLVQAGQIGLGRLLVGLDRGMRIASAHDEFALEDDEVVLIDRGIESERLSIAVLVDRVLAGVETTLALGLGVLCAAIHGGIELEQVLPDLDTLGVAPNDALTWILSSSGWREVQIRSEADVLIASGVADEEAVTMPHVAALFPYVPQTCREVVVLAETTSGSREIRGPSEPFRAFQAATDELEKQARHVELLRSWTGDGIPLMDASQVRKVVSVLALQVLASGDAREAIRQLRMLLETGRRLGDAELTDSLAALIGGLRDSLAGLGAGAYSSAVERTQRWASMRVAPMPGLLTG